MSWATWFALLCASAPPAAVKTDAYGDPLPEGAVARLGTTDRRMMPPSEYTFIADGKTLVTLNSGLTVQFWDVATGRLLRTVQFDGRPTPQVVLSGDGGTAATYAWPKGIEVWDVATGKLRCTLPHGERESVYRMCLSADGRALAVTGSAGLEGVARVWDVAGGQSRTVGNRRGYIDGLAFGQDGRHLFTADSQALHCWDPTAGRVVWKIDGRCEGHNLKLLPDGKTLAAPGCSETTVPR
jgi:WD40 repeat protein